jgi:hypothetical protein
MPRDRTIGTELTSEREMHTSVERVKDLSRIERARMQVFLGSTVKGGSRPEAAIHTRVINSLWLACQLPRVSSARQVSERQIRTLPATPLRELSKNSIGSADIDWNSRRQQELAYHSGLSCTHEHSTCSKPGVWRVADSDRSGRQLRYVGPADSICRPRRCLPRRVRAIPSLDCRRQWPSRP